MTVTRAIVCSLILTLTVLSGCGVHVQSALCAAPLGAIADSETTVLQSDVRIVRRSVTPAAKFPARIAVARVQSGWGGSKENQGPVMEVRTVASEREQNEIEHLAELPSAAGVTTISRLIVSEHASEARLRAAADALHADVLMLYTLASSSETHDSLPPASVLTLGLFPGQIAKSTVTASALILDVQTGYVFAAAEAVVEREQLAAAWTSGSAEEQTRRRAEDSAIAELFETVDGEWASMLTRHASAEK